MPVRHREGVLCTESLWDPVVAFFDSVLNQLVGLTNVLTRLQLLWYLSRHSSRLSLSLLL